MIDAKSIRRSLLAVVLSAAAVVLVAAPADAATCGPSPETIAAADVVFVGTLTVGGAAGTQGTFAVEEVWKGDVPALVVVTGHSEQWSRPGADVRSLVLATVVETSLRVGVECSWPYVWDPSYAAFRPAGAHQPQPTSDEGGGLPLPLFAIAGAAALLLTVSVLAFRRGSS
jgi:hypothetical protein